MSRSLAGEPRIAPLCRYSTKGRVGDSSKIVQTVPVPRRVQSDEPPRARLGLSIPLPARLSPGLLPLPVGAGRDPTRTLARSCLQVARWAQWPRSLPARVSRVSPALNCPAIWPRRLAHPSKVASLSPRPRPTAAAAPWPPRAARAIELEASWSGARACESMLHGTYHGTYGAFGRVLVTPRRP